jgi:acyl-CoA thioester hydrolase
VARYGILRDFTRAQTTALTKRIAAVGKDTRRTGTNIREGISVESVVTTTLEVRWGECDPAGIVYHPAYIDWFSVARMRFLKANGVSYMEAFHDAGVVLVVLEAQCRYVKALRAEDEVAIEARLVERSKTRIALEYEVKNRLGERCASGRTEHAFVDMATNHAVNLAKRASELWQSLTTLPLSGPRPS